MMSAAAPSSVSGSGTGSMHSEASKLLEAALEQMDGIIQGAKYDLPNAGGLPPGSGSTSGDWDSPSLGRRPRQVSDLSSALRQLRLSIVSNSSSSGVKHGSDAGWMDALDGEDSDNLNFISRWIQNNPRAWPQMGTSLQEKYLQSEAEKDAVQLQLGLLKDQLERQGTRCQDLEQLLHAKKELLKKTEQALERERHARTNNLNHASSTPSSSNDNNQNHHHYSELMHFKNRCNALELENQELRKIVGGNRTPKYLPISPHRTRHNPHASGSRSTDDSSPDDMSPTMMLGKKEVGFTNQDENIPSPPTSANNHQHLQQQQQQPQQHNNEILETSFNSGSSRPPRGLKKMLSKIKRSNSGGHLEDGKSNRSDAPEFRRGGFRATTGGRLGWSVDRSKEFKRPLSDWNVDTICTWLECLGLGMYCGEVQKTIGTGEQLAKMTFNDLETKLNVRNQLHKKKFFLALVARQDTNRPDLEGGLDYQWVLRWLDDVGLPQYKDAFLEARVDGRVLNVLTVEDLFQLKITNQLHHLSLKRGIQVLRMKNFEQGCLKRRAIPGESINPQNVSLWTNHRVMEWLKQVDLSEYAPNLRGSGVHGSLLINEPRFTDDVMASLLSIPGSKTLLRRHLSIHFKELIGRDVMLAKRAIEQDEGYVALTPTAKAKSGRKELGQFTLKRKKSKSQFDYGDLVCPFENNTPKSQHKGSEK